MKIIVCVRGVSPDNTWKYQDFTYSCIEYNDSHRYSCIEEGQGPTSTAKSYISTCLSFVSPCITPDTKEQLLLLLKDKLNSQFTSQMPSTAELKAIASEIRQCLVPSLKNICFRYFLFSDPHHGESISNAPSDIQRDFEEFKYVCRLNERW